MSAEQTDVEKKEVTMVEKTMVNTGAYTSTWIGLSRAEDKLDKDGAILAAKGSTLELEPGEQALTVVSSDFVDPWLKEAKVGAPKKTGAPKPETQKEG